MESLEKVPAIELGHFFQVPPLPGSIELVDVAPQTRAVDRDLFSPDDEQRFVEVIAQVVDGLPQGMPGVGVVALRPEERDQRVAPAALLPGQRQERKQRKAFRLGQHVRCRDVPHAQIDRPQRAELHRSLHPQRFLSRMTIRIRSGDSLVRSILGPRSDGNAVRAPHRSLERGGPRCERLLSFAFSPVC